MFTKEFLDIYSNKKANSVELKGITLLSKLGAGLFLFVMITDLFLVFKLKKGQFFSGLENASSQTKTCSVKN